MHIGRCGAGLPLLDPYPIRPSLLIWKCCVALCLLSVVFSAFSFFADCTKIAAFLKAMVFVQILILFGCRLKPRSAWEFRSSKFSKFPVRRARLSPGNEMLTSISLLLPEVHGQVKARSNFEETQQLRRESTRCSCNEVVVPFCCCPTLVKRL